MKPCPFCNVDDIQILRRLEDAIAISDGYPLTGGHTLIIPVKHVASIFSLTTEAQAAIWTLVTTVRADLVERYQPDAFTIGVNDGIAAGQTVAHAHVHIIPRKLGDVSDPRGGVRWVLPAKAKYWTDFKP